MPQISWTLFGCQPSVRMVPYLILLLIMILTFFWRTNPNIYYLVYCVICSSQIYGFHCAYNFGSIDDGVYPMDTWIKMDFTRIHTFEYPISASDTIHVTKESASMYHQSDSLYATERVWAAQCGARYPGALPGRAQRRGTTNSVLLSYAINVPGR